MTGNLKNRMEKLELSRPRVARFVAELPAVIEDPQEWLAHTLAIKGKPTREVFIPGRLDRYVRTFRTELVDTLEQDQAASSGQNARQTE